MFPNAICQGHQNACAMLKYDKDTSQKGTHDILIAFGLLESLCLQTGTDTTPKKFCINTYPYLISICQPSFHCGKEVISNTQPLSQYTQLHTYPHAKYRHSPRTQRNKEYFFHLPLCLFCFTWSPSFLYEVHSNHSHFSCSFPT